ncbi:hypothetical protein F5878DRAFT_632615 [Lentinula raphanica]|uniref:Secreted protein n=1 Tax=Lentinula raphanica TaxID=153919 RepID=A0AA38NZI1_9AGAR|nr:hypothetical protein F5878DRAFT_632615 [Lentinula raphanica]
MGLFLRLVGITRLLVMRAECEKDTEGRWGLGGCYVCSVKEIANRFVTGHRIGLSLGNGREPVVEGQGFRPGFRNQCVRNARPQVRGG